MKFPHLLTAAATFSLLIPVLSLAAAEKAELKEGDAAPKFTAKDDTGKDWKAEDVYGKKIVVIYFYPADLTGGCTKQACGFRDDMTGLKDKGIEVVGVSGDSVRNHQLFKKVHDLNFTLLADEDGSVAKAFDVPLRAGGEITRQIDGEDFVLKRGVTAERWTIIVDKEGKVARRYKVKDAAGDSQNILKAIAELQ
ncbi:MAG: peroxiredoxin [Planctomycetaceae bacterium]|nr:peroxiredoxin [Planctomycetaceae bacterium]